MIRDAILSSDKIYRYVLIRDWDANLNHVSFIGLNPSIADAELDDPTIRRCIGFAKSWGYGAIMMLNLFAYRSTDPSALYNIKDPIGPLNDDWLKKQLSRADKIIACWGTKGSYKNRDKEIIKMIPNLYCLGKTKNGYPKHPLYICADQQPIKFI